MIPESQNGFSFLLELHSLSLSLLSAIGCKLSGKLLKGLRGYAF